MCHAAFWERRSSNVTHSSPVIRVSIPDLGSPEWGDVKPRVCLHYAILSGTTVQHCKDILRFLYHMRSLARRSVSTSHACFFVTLPSYLSQDSWGGPGWSQKLGWLSDGCIALCSFSGTKNCFSPTAWRNDGIFSWSSTAVNLSFPSWFDWYPHFAFTEFIGATKR